MAEPENLESRVTALEDQVRQLTQAVRVTAQDAAAARVLAGGADRDVDQIRGEIRDFRQATTASINALREDMVDLRTRVEDGFAKVDARFEKVDARFEKVDGNFAKVDKGFIEMRGKFDALAAGQQQIVDLLTGVIDRDDPSGG